MNIKSQNLHIFATCALFTLGNMIISLPFYTFGVISLFLSALTSILGILLSIFLKKKSNNKTWLFVTALFLFASSIYSVWVSLKDYIDFLKSEQMPQTNKFLLFVTVSLVVLFFVFSSKSSIYKYGLFTFALCCFIIMLFLLSGIKNFDFSLLNKDLFICNLNFNFLKFFVFAPFFNGIVLSFFLQKKDSTSKPVFWGCITGFVMLFLCFFQVILSLKPTYETAYPYFRAISVISAGSLFTRLDGLAYFMFFVCAIIKISICIKAIFLTFSMLRKKN